MKTTKLAALVATIAIALFILIPNLSWAEDGAGLYKAKCAACHGADGAGKPAGHSSVTLEEEDCVLIERWTSVAGNTGLSMNFYDPLANTWTQQWVGLGLLLRMTGGLRDGSMVLEGPLQYVGTSRVMRLRGTWTALPDGRVRQHFQESADDGKTWQEWFDGYYRRVAQP